MQRGASAPACRPMVRSLTALFETAANGLHHAELALPAAEANKTVLCRATLKAAGRTWARLSFFDRAGVQCFTDVDLANGVLGLQSGLVSRTLESRDNGYWRLTLTAPVASGGGTPAMRISAISASNNPSYAGNAAWGLGGLGDRRAHGHGL